MQDDYSDLDTFQNDFKPEQAIKPGPEVLADGEYEFEITGCALEKTPQTQDRVFRMDLRVIATGQELQRTNFLKTQKNVNILAGDLLALGLPTNTWGTAANPLSKALPAAAAGLKGVCFRGKKDTTKDKDDAAKTYHNIRIVARIRKPGGSPAVPATVPNCVPAPPAVAGTDDVPF